MLPWLYLSVLQRHLQILYEDVRLMVCKLYRFTKFINSTAEMAMATTLSPPKSLNIYDSESEETDSDPLSPRFITTPVDTPMSIAGTPFILDSQQSTISQQSNASSSSEDVLVTISHDPHCVIILYCC